jgi:hypothetical protein
MPYLRLFALLTLMSFTSYANAQFVKGTRMAGASVASIFFNAGNSDQSVASIGNTTGRTTGYNINITPSLGWFLSSKTAVGFLVSINPSGEKVSYEENGSTFQRDKSRNFNAGIGGFVRHYFGAEGSLLPFGQLAVDAGKSSTTKDGFFYGGRSPNVYRESYDTKSSEGFYSNAGLMFGLTKMVGKYTGLDLYAGYNYSYNKNTFKTTRLRDIEIDGTIDETLTNETTGRFHDHRFTIGLGFQIFLERKKR